MSVDRWQNFAKFILAKTIVKKCAAEYYYTNMTADFPSPFLIVANHTTVYDPFLLSIGLRQTIRYVTSDLYFRSPILGFLAKKAGCIPKAKFVTDIQIIKMLIKCRDAHKSVGVFPEGYRIWDGQTDQIPFSTAKLIKLLKMPVIAAVIKGGYLSMPRWAKFDRKGKMEIHYSLILTEEDIAKLSVKQIYENITNALQYNDINWQRGIKVVYHGKKLAQSLELMLYCCPVCHSFETMTSNDNKFECTKCGYAVTFNAYGFFETDQKSYFDNAYDWKKFCDLELEKQLQFCDNMNDIYSKREVTLLRESNKGHLFKIYAQGETAFCRDGFDFRGRGKNMFFPFADLSGISVSKKNMLDFYYNGVKYRIAPRDNTCSAVFWEKGVKILTGNKTE